MGEKGWYQKAHEQDGRFLVAYFSAEFGIHESLPVYSGGLGVLAGDHLKSASEIGLPLVGVGLLYRNGYFQQYLSADGWQQEAYPELDFYNLPIEALKHTDGTPVHVRVELPDNSVFCQVWPRSRSGASRCICWTPICRKIPPPTGKSPAASTAVGRKCASSRKSSWASAVCGRLR